MSSQKTIKPPLSFQNQIIAYLHGQIAQQKQVLQAVRAVLPEELATQVRHCLIKEQKLLVYTDSAVWASQLRFYHSVILAAVSASLIKEVVTTVQIRIITQRVGEVARSERKARIPCPDTIVQLEKASRDIADESLQQALLKLSATLMRLSKQSSE